MRLKILYFLGGCVFSSLVVGFLFYFQYLKTSKPSQVEKELRGLVVVMTLGEDAVSESLHLDGDFKGSRVDLVLGLSLRSAVLFALKQEESWLDFFLARQDEESLRRYGFSEDEISNILKEIQEREIPERIVEIADGDDYTFQFLDEKER